MTSNLLRLSMQTNTMDTTYCVAKLDDTGHHVRITKWQTYDECDAVIDELQDRFSFAYVDIYTNLELPDL